MDRPAQRATGGLDSFVGRRRLSGLLLLLLLSVSLLHLLRQLLVLLLLLGVELLLVLLVLAGRFRIWVTWGSWLLMRRKILRMDRSGRSRNVILGTCSRCVRWTRSRFLRVWLRMIGRSCRFGPYHPGAAK